MLGNSDLFPGALVCVGRRSVLQDVSSRRRNKRRRPYAMPRDGNGRNGRDGNGMNGKGGKGMNGKGGKDKHGE